MTDEKRRFGRIFFDVQAKLLVGGSIYQVDRIANLSVGGCLLEIDEPFPLGSACTFTILLPRMAPGVEVLGEVARVANGEVSLKFTAIEPENLFHLQNIIRYNADNPEAVEQEISNHPGLR